MGQRVMSRPLCRAQQLLRRLHVAVPVENRACDFHRTRLSTFGRSPWASMKRLFPFRQLHGAFTRGQLARSLGTFVPIFSKG